MTALSDDNWASLMCLIMILSLLWKAVMEGPRVFHIMFEHNSYGSIARGKECIRDILKLFPQALLPQT